MIIVTGWLRVAPDDRDAYLDSSRPVIEAARAAPGCLDFHLSADSLEPGRINVVEQWESAEAVEAFRRSGPTDEPQVVVVDASVEQHEIASTIVLS